jgi:hypothetical protein
MFQRFQRVRESKAIAALDESPYRDASFGNPASRRPARNTLSNLDLPLEDKLRGPGEAHVSEVAVQFLKAHLELVTALDLDVDWGGETVDSRGNESRGGYAGAAGQRFAFHTALERADADVAPTEDLHKIHVSAFGSEAPVVPDFRSDVEDHRLIRIRHEQDGVRDAGIH